MKRLISLILSLLLLFVQISFADDYAIFGGIKGDLTLKAGVYYYQEVVFSSGEPIILSGTATIPVVPDKDTYTLSIKYSLANTAAQASLERIRLWVLRRPTNPRNILGRWSEGRFGHRRQV